jgi:hypothetical protein
MGLVVDSQSTETAGEGVRVLMLVDETPTGPDVTISGDAADLDLWLWHRADGSTLAVEGDPGVYAHIVAAMSRTV